MRRAFASFVCLVVIAACGSSGEAQRVITVFAAASLTDVFKALGPSFEKANPGVVVRFNFAGTPTLLTQIEQGAKADLFASADTTNMDKLVADGFATGHAPVVIAYNKLEIVVAPHNPKEIVRLEDLARPEVTYISAAPTVPAGKYAAQVLGKAGVKATPRSLETDVKSVVSKIELGEADAGIVYVTDVKAAGDKVTGVEIPDQYNVVATYPAVIVKGAAHPEVAQGFIDYLTHGPGLTLLATYGFQPA